MGFLDFGYAFARNDVGFVLVYNVILVKCGSTVSRPSLEKASCALGFIRLIAITTLLALEIKSSVFDIKCPFDQGSTIPRPFAWFTMSFRPE